MTNSSFKVAKSLIVTKPQIAHFSKFAPKQISLPKKMRAVVSLNKKGEPSWFLFDLYSFWEFICRIDEKLFEKLSDEEYDSVTIGKLIDAIEAKWPFNENDKVRIKKEYERALKNISKGKMYDL